MRRSRSQVSHILYMLKVFVQIVAVAMGFACMVYTMMMWSVVAQGVWEVWQ